MDLKLATIDLGLIAPEIIIAAVAMLILLLGNVVRRRTILAYFGLFGLVAALLTALPRWGNPASGFYGMVQADNFAIFFKIIFIIAAGLTILMARRYLISHEIESPEFYALLLFSAVGMMVMAATSDLVVIFLGLEIMSVPLYVMAAFARHDVSSNEAGIKYFIMGAFASGILIYGIALVYGATGTTDLRRILADWGFFEMHSQLFLYSGAILVLIGFGFKVAAVPFHMWVPDVYQGAPTPVTAFFSVAPKAAGFAALLRIFTYGFADMSQLWAILWILAVLTMTVGNILAIFQDNIKRMLAYSSIAHAGYILVALTAGGDGAVSSAAYYLLAYTFFNLGAFAVITLIDTRNSSTAQIDEMQGLSGRHPFLAAVLALFMFALAGFPPTAGFMGKFYIFSEAIKNGYIGLAIIGVMNSFVSVYYYLRVVVVSFFARPNKEFEAVSYTPAIFIVLVITAAGTLILGILPGYWLSLARAGIFQFL